MSRPDHGIERLVSGNTTLILQGLGQVWRVQSGSVAIFAVELANGVPSGSRRYLFSCSETETLFGVSSDVLEVSKESAGIDGRFGLIVVGLTDSVLLEMPMTAISESDRANGLKSWLEKLAQALTAKTKTPYTERLDTGQHSLLEAQKIRSNCEDLVVLEVQKGELKLFGLEPLRLTGSSGKLLLSQDLWLQSRDDAEIQISVWKPQSSDEQSLSSLQLLMQLCFVVIAEERRLTIESDKSRLEEARKLTQIESQGTIQKLVEVLDPGLQRSLRKTPLLSALAALEPSLGFQFDAMEAVAVEDIEELATRCRVRVRKVQLADDWFLKDGGSLLGFLADGKRPVALVRRTRFAGLQSWYELIDDQNEGPIVVDRDIDQLLDREAMVFTRPLSDRVATSNTKLIGFISHGRKKDVIFLLMLALLGTVLAMIQPIVTKQVMDKAVPIADSSYLKELAVALVVMAIGVTSFAVCQGLVAVRMSSAVSAGFQSSVFDRLLRLPQSFFRKYSTGDLANRGMMVHEISQALNGAAVTGIVSGLLCSLNVVLCYLFSPELAWVAIIAASITGLSALAFSIPIRRKALALERLEGNQRGLVVQLVQGISKLRVSNSEERAFNVWAQKYAKQLEYRNSIQNLENWSGVTNTALQTGSLLVLFAAAAKVLEESGLAASSQGVVAAQAGTAAMLTVGTFMAFHAAFLVVMEGMISFTTVLVDVMDSWAKRKLIAPLLETPTEDSELASDPGLLSGHVALDKVSFRYDEDGPMILNEVSIEARPGEFIALVGPSGCGKSTVFRLLLGFDTPEQGLVSFDHQDLASLEKSAVRRQIGTVTQSGRINAGSIFNAIRGGAKVSLEDAWEAARDAGFAEDVEAMPMQMHSVIQEGGTTLSGGQRQRLLIARALVRNPRILLLDEATSALDNRTQQIVSESLARRKVTRVVVAHRFSTIQDAHRIYVLTGGKLVQTGTYDELMAEDGLFKVLASRQVV